MKKVAIPFVIILIIVIAIALNLNSSYQLQIKEAQKINADYESFYNVEVLGTDIISIINKTMYLNEKNGISKEGNGEYQENDTNSIIITVQFKGKEDKIYTYRMEAIAKGGTEAFVKQFGGITFKCTKLEYHEKTKKVKSLFIEQI